jgi:hypothetical protein
MNQKRLTHGKKKGERKMKKILTAIIIGLLCLPMFSIFVPHVRAQADPLFASAYGGDPGRDEIMFTSDDLDYVTVINSVKLMGITVLTVDCQPSATAGYANDAHNNFEYISQTTGGKHFDYTSSEWNVALATEISSRIGSGKGDVVFTFDLTGSMGWVTGDLKVRTKGIIEALPTTLNIAFGIGTHVDYPHSYNSYGYSDMYGESPDYAWKLNLDITTDRNVAKNVIDGMTNYWGADGPQDYARVLYETQFYSWRSDSRKIVVMFGDAPAHSAPSGLTLGAKSQKELLMDALRALNEETDRAMEKQVEYFSKIWATYRIETYEPDWWKIVKLTAGFIGGKVEGADLFALVPAKYAEAAKIAKKVYDGVEWYLRGQTLVEIVLPKLLEDSSLSPTLGLDELTRRYRDGIISSWLYPQFESGMDTILTNTLSYFDSLPDSDPTYSYAMSEIGRVQRWMLAIQSEETTINYIDLSADSLVSTAKVGGMVEQYYPQFRQLLDSYKAGKTVEDVSSYVIIGGLCAKGIGALLVEAGIGVAIIVSAETYVAPAIGVAGVVDTASSIYEMIPEMQAVSLTLSRILPALSADEISVESVYKATFDLVQKWSQKETYPVESCGFDLDQETFIAEPWWSPDSIPTAPIFFQLNVGGTAFIKSEYSSRAKARFALEVTDFFGEKCYTVGGIMVEVNPGECVAVSFSLPMADLLSFGETEKTYKVVGFMSFGTSIYILPSETFRVVRNSKDAVCSMSTSTISSTITSDETLSFPINIPKGSFDFAISLDFPGSDLDLHLYDSGGRHTGIDYITGTVQTQIPGSSYSGQTLNPEWITVQGDVGGQTLTASVVGVDVDGSESFSLSYLTESNGIMIAPPSITVSPGQTALYNVTVTNLGDATDTFAPALSGLDPTWYSFSPSSLMLVPSESANASLRVTPPPTSTIGSYPFDVTISGAPEKTSALLTLEKPHDNTPPTTTLAVGNPQYPDGADRKYITSATPLTLTAEDNVGGTGVASTGYRIRSTTQDYGWTTAMPPIQFYLTGLADGNYFVDYNSSDILGNIEPTNTATLILDNTPPTTNLTIGEPKYVSGRTYVTPDTPFILAATDTGSGVNSTAYRITNSTSYDSGWLTYIKPFNLTSLRDGNYTIAFNSTDNVGNVENTNSMNVALVGPDINGDGEVNLKDYFTACNAFGSCPGHPRWNPAVDINLDGHINLIDIFRIVVMFGKHYP